ncbi:MAG TPA: molybdopterin cofactor-binding domain-containing protein, partial [Pseudonocardiaceae bacterium]|nr:molybdopterin cofactor-binding domain-containing protein [Pseudonocardiaceae bacterium]
MTELSPSLTANPDPGRWLELRPDGIVLVRSGKVELGQGVLTALAQIVADELDVDIARIRMATVQTGLSPDEGYTAGSLSMQHSGSALRVVAARLRAALVAAAAAKLGVATDELIVADGEIRGPGGVSTSYWELAESVAESPVVDAPVKPARAHKVVGGDVPRIDIPGKVFGTRRYVHDLRFAGQLFGRVLRPPARGARLVEVDEGAVSDLPGVVVVRDGDFVGVLAEREDVAVRAVAALDRACRWEHRDTLPDERTLADFLTSAPSDEHLLYDTGTAPLPGATTVTARFTRPYLAHASIAPSCAVARWHNGKLAVWSHTQGVYQLRAELARWFGLAPDDVSVEHVEGAGCYGHNAADDAAGDAALLARAVPGRHVQVVWSRPDELGWAPFGPAMAVEVTVELDAAGEIHHWRQEVWSNGHTSRPSSRGNPPLLAAAHQGRPPTVSSDPPLANGGGSGRNAVPGYRLPGLTVVSHVLRDMPLRTSALRAL